MFKNLYEKELQNMTWLIRVASNLFEKVELHRIKMGIRLSVNHIASKHKYYDYFVIPFRKLLFHLNRFGSKRKAYFTTKSSLNIYCDQAVHIDLE